LLGVVPDDKVPEMVSLTETSNKIGTFFFTLGTGFLSYYTYPNVSSIFYLLGAGGLAATFFVLFIPRSSIDDMRARAANVKGKDLERPVKTRQLSQGALNKSLSQVFFSSQSEVSLLAVDKEQASLRRLMLSAPESMRSSLYSSSRELSLLVEEVEESPKANDAEDGKTVSNDVNNSDSPIKRSESLRISLTEKKASFLRYRDLFQDRKIVMFALCTFFYHLCNAAVLPLVAQLIAHEDQRSGLAFTSGVLCIVYLVQAPTAYVVGRIHDRYDYKTMLIVGHLILPVRCVLCALLAMFNPNRYALAATQILEGLGAGIYDTLVPLVVKVLVEGSGRYGFTFGFIITCWRLGHGLSLLVAEAILKAADKNYEVPFFVLGAGGLLVSFMLWFGVTIPSNVKKGAST